MQAFQLEDATRRVPLLGAVGPLQFDVVQFRLKDEYRVDSTLESAPWTVLRWIHEGKVDPARLVTGAQYAVDGAGHRGRALPGRVDLPLLRREEPGREVRDDTADGRPGAGPRATVGDWRVEDTTSGSPSPDAAARRYGGVAGRSEPEPVMPVASPANRARDRQAQARSA